MFPGPVQSQTGHETVDDVGSVRIKGRSLRDVRRDGAAGYGHLIKAGAANPVRSDRASAHSVRRP